MCGTGSSLADAAFRPDILALLAVVLGVLLDVEPPLAGLWPPLRR